MTTLRSIPRSRGRHAWPLYDHALAAGHARNLIRDFLTGLGLHGELVDDAVLMTSELVTNAYLYGEAPYELVVNAGSDEIVCVVVDSGTLLPARREAATDTERGRGLHIVALLSDGFYGHHPQRYVTRPGLTGKATWFALPRRDV